MFCLRDVVEHEDRLLVDRVHVGFDFVDRSLVCRRRRTPSDLLEKNRLLLLRCVWLRAARVVLTVRDADWPMARLPMLKMMTSFANTTASTGVALPMKRCLVSVLV